jgi:hypothetical protein
MPTYNMGRTVASVAEPIGNATFREQGKRQFAIVELGSEPPQAIVLPEARELSLF